jgi:hypothetical protein
LGAIANFTYSKGKSRFSLKNLYNRIFDDQHLERSGYNNGTTSDIQFYAFDLVQKGLIKSTLEGEHSLGVKNSKLRWNVGISNVLNQQPDQRKVSYSRNLSTGDEYTANVTTLGKENTRLFSDLSENIYSGDVNYFLPVKMFKQSGSIKFGATTQYRDREFDVRFLGLELNPNTPNFNEIRTRPLNSLFGQDLIDNGAYQLKEIANSGDRYNGYALTNSAFAMLDNMLTNKLRLVWGVRAEKYDMDLSTYDTSQPDIILNNFDVLPSLNFTYNLSAKSNLRLSYFRTLARPELRELAPFSVYDYELLGLQQGNSQLKRSLIDNADLRYELFPASGQIMSVSMFYKKFNNAIEASVEDYTSTPIFSYFNSEKANVYGMEVEFRRTLSLISNGNFFKNTTFYTNASIIKSLVQNPENSPFIEKERPLIGQAPYVVNAGLQHSELNNKLSLNLLYNRVGRRIFRAGGQNFTSIWENPRNVVDFQASYRIIKNRGDLKLNVSDILNNSQVLYFDNNGSKRYESNGVDETVGRYKPGTNISLSLGYSF